MLTEFDSGWEVDWRIWRNKTFWVRGNKVEVEHCKLTGREGPGEEELAGSSAFSILCCNGMVDV